MTPLQNLPHAVRSRRNARKITMPVVTLAFASIIQPPGPPPLRPLDDPDAVAVYARVLQGNELVRTLHATMFVLQAESATTRPATCKLVIEPASNDWQSVLADYAAQNTRRSFPSGMALGLPYVVVSSAALVGQRTVAGSGWERWSRQYPEAHGYIRLSAVGFDSPKTHALVYVEHYCAAECGGGQHYLLQKTNGVWAPAVGDVSTCNWIS
jgi:hypothetical protein